MAFVRVKRRNDEDPYNSIVVSHKKLKSVGADSSVDCVFQFAATLKDQNENLSQLFKDVRERKSLKYLTKTIKNKNVHDVIEHSKAERLKLVNTLRAVKQDTIPIDEKDGGNVKIKVVDFIKQAEDNRKPQLDEGISIDYVYDLYYASNNDEKSIDIQDIDSVHGLDSEKFFKIYDNLNDSDDSSHCGDEDDSNDECNWRNDYPDEDEMDNSDKECEDLNSRTKYWQINSGSSSNSENDKSLDSEDNVEDYDVNFAKYRQRVKIEEHFFYNSVMEKSSSSDSDD